MSDETPVNPLHNLEASSSKTNEQIEPRSKSKDIPLQNNGPSNEMWEVEKITRKRMHHGTQQWLVKWKGYPANESTWEPRESFVNDPDITYNAHKKGSNQRGKPNFQKQVPKKKIEKRGRRSRALQINDPSQEASNDTEKCLSGSYYLNSQKNHDRDSVCKSTVSATTVSTEETIEKESVQRFPSHQIIKEDCQFKNAQVAFEPVVDEEEDTDWRKNEVRIAVQSHIDHNRPAKEVVIPSDLDTEFIKKTVSTNPSDDHFSQTSLGRQTSIKISSGNKSSLFNNFKTGEDDDWPLDQGADFYPFSPKPQIDNFDFLRDPAEMRKSIMSEFNSRDNENDALYKCPNPTKKVCTMVEKGANAFEYTIQNIDYYKRTIEVQCNYSSNNEHFYTKWLSVDQSATICPHETIDYLLNLTYTNNMLKGAQD